jgi:hypothetical protein
MQFTALPSQFFKMVVPIFHLLIIPKNMEGSDRDLLRGTGFLFF